MAVFILLIACINYINLAVTRLTGRIKEVAIRKVSGAKKTQLIGQFLCESITFALISLIFSLFMVWTFLPLLNSLTDKSLSFNILINQSTIFYLFILTFFIGIISGIYPALYITKQKPVNALKGSGAFSSHRSLFRIISVVGQFTISILLIIGRTVIFKQINFIQNKPLGLSADQVIKIPINRKILLGFDNYKNEISKDPHILNVSAGQSVPFNEDYKTGGLNWEGKDPSRMTMIRYSIAHYDYLRTFGIGLAAGRSFQKNIGNDFNNFMINEKAVDYMKMKNLIGKSITFWGRKGQIIGVVKNYHHVSLHREIMPQIFTVNPRYHSALKYIFIKIANKNIPETLKFIKEKTKFFSPGLPFSYSFLDSEVQSMYNSEMKTGKLIGYFSFFAIFISCLGIFGLASFMAKKRTKEIGIRKVVGASVPGIVYLLNKQFAQWVFLANIMAWPLAYYVMSKWLSNFAYRTNIDIWIFLFAGLLAVVIAIGTATFQSVKVACLNPVSSLRCE